MIDLKVIIEKTKAVKKALNNRGLNPKIVDEIVILGNKRSEIMTNLQKKQSERNVISKQISSLKQAEKKVLIKKMILLKKEINSLKTKENNVKNKINKKILSIPNVPEKDVPVGKDETFNKIIFVSDPEIEKKNTKVIPYYEIGKKLKIFESKNSARMSGARFWTFLQNGAQLVRALINFMIDTHIKNGYQEIMPPVLVNAQTLIGTGQLPKFYNDLFKIENKDLFLIPTAEVPVTNFYGNQILDLDQTISLVSYTQCFRQEAGSGGKDTKELIRGHQFNKVELVKITKMANIKKEFTNMIQDVENILILLKIPYRKVILATGDLGFSAKKTIDFEIWIPSEKKYREISSVSLFGDFQSRRAMIRYKEDQKNTYAGTINGSGLAIDRTIAAILEHYQEKGKYIKVPKVLQPYLKQGIIE